MVRWDGIHDDLPRIRIRWITKLQHTGSLSTKTAYIRPLTITNRISSISCLSARHLSTR